MLHELNMKYAILLIAISASIATLAFCQSLEQSNSIKSEQDQTDDKLTFSPPARQPKYSSSNGLYYGKYQRGPSMSADAIWGILGKRASAYTMGTDMISGMNPIGKRAPSMGTDMITGMMPIGKRAYAVGTDMISGMMPIGKRFEFINMKPILYQRHYSGYSPRYSDSRWSDYDADASPGLD